MKNVNPLFDVGVNEMLIQFIHDAKFTRHNSVVELVIPFTMNTIVTKISK